MKRHYRTLLILAVLVLSALACKTLTGAPVAPDPVRPQEENLTDDVIEPVEEPTRPVEKEKENEKEVVPIPDLSFETDFPLPASVINPIDMGGTFNFQTDLSLDEVLTFYRDAFTAQGYIEREVTTAITDVTFSIVFDGHESGQAIVVQAVDLGNGTVNVNIRFEDV